MERVDERATNVSRLHMSPLHSSICHADASSGHDSDSHNNDGVLVAYSTVAFKIEVTVNAIIAFAGEAHRRGRRVRVHHVPWKAGEGIIHLALRTLAATKAATITPRPVPIAPTSQHSS